MKELNASQVQHIGGGLISNPIDHFLNIVAGCVVGNTIAKAFAPESVFVQLAVTYLGGTVAQGLSAWAQNQEAQDEYIFIY